MNAPELDAVLVHAKDHGEALLFVLPDGWELVPEPPLDCPVMPHFLDDGDELLDDTHDVIDADHAHTLS